MMTVSVVQSSLNSTLSTQLSAQSCSENRVKTGVLPTPQSPIPSDLLGGCYVAWNGWYSTGFRLCPTAGNGLSRSYLSERNLWSTESGYANAELDRQKCRRESESEIAHSVVGVQSETYFWRSRRRESSDAGGRIPIKQVEKRRDLRSYVAEVGELLLSLLML